MRHVTSIGDNMSRFIKNDPQGRIGTLKQISIRRCGLIEFQFIKAIAKCGFVKIAHIREECRLGQIGNLQDHLILIDAHIYRGHVRKQIWKGCGG